ncbi:MAG: hypothetical protein L3J07_02355 [Candidatus Magasanikbacteria bacterium]|nr:hypothetical protein [Candidatus Magasanikbacteria bacterium]
MSISFITKTAWVINPDDPSQIEYFLFLNAEKMEADQNFKDFLGEEYSVVDLGEYVNDLLDFILVNCIQTFDFIYSKQQENYAIAALDISQRDENNVSTDFLFIIVLEKIDSDKKNHLKLVE